jgi:hypothetical protein
MHYVICHFASGKRAFEDPRFQARVLLIRQDGKSVQSPGKSLCQKDLKPLN